MGRTDNRRIGVVVPCTKMKHDTASLQMQFHSLPTMRVDRLASEWTRRAESVDGHFEAERLYKGAGWRHSEAAFSTLQNAFGNTRMYIMSAGFGFLRSTDLVPPYSATFTADEDQVARRVKGTRSTVEAHRQWWKAINAARSSTKESPLAELLDCQSVMVAASVDYLEAIKDDLLVLTNKLGPERLLVISVGGCHGEPDESIRACILTMDTSIECSLPGPRSTINQRVLRWIATIAVEEGSLGRSLIEREVSRVLTSCQETVKSKPKRELHRMGDAGIEGWIRSRLDQQPGAAKSTLLRTFRERNSCEQARFSRLFDMVRQQERRSMI